MPRTLLGRRLQALGLSQKRLADILGLAPESVSRFAHGKEPMPRYLTAYLDLLEKVQGTKNAL